MKDVNIRLHYAAGKDIYAGDVPSALVLTKLAAVNRKLLKHGSLSPVESNRLDTLLSKVRHMSPWLYVGLKCSNRISKCCYHRSFGSVKSE